MKNLKEERKSELQEINKKWYHNKTRVFSLCCLFVWALLFKGCVDYTWNNKTEVTVIDKMESKNSNYYLILKDTKGRIFDQIVSPATYSQSKNNAVCYLCLSEMDIKQTSIKNLFFFILPILLIVIGLVCFCLSFVKEEIFL